MKDRRIARCIGEDNLSQALEDLESQGYDIEFLIFTGMVPLSPLKGDIITSQAAVTRVVGTYLVIGTRLIGPQRVN